MDPSSENSKKGFRNPPVLALIGIILGIALGLVYGWLISPVKLIDMDVPQLRDDLKLEYLRIAVDSYSHNKDTTLAITRYDRLGADAETYLAEIEFTPGDQALSDIEAFRDLVVIPTQGDGSEESSDGFSGIDILKWSLLVVIIAAASLVARFFLINRGSSQVSPQADLKEPRTSPPENASTSPSRDKGIVIEADHLTKYYGKARGIVDVSFSVYEGEIYGFIGPNGAGKSTTIRLFLSLIYPTSGKARIFGQDCIKFGPEIRKEIGYLPSEVFYYEGMKVLDLLKYSASFYDKDCTDRIYQLAEIMELDLKRKIDDLSYGNKKKVGIVQGLLHQPRLIILDEPTSGLDPLMQQKFFNLIREENQRGATIFFSSHILGEVQKLCQRVAIIKEGSIINIQDIKTLQKDNYKKIRVVAEDINPEMFQVEGVTNLSSENGAVNFFFKGNINRITRIISHRDLSDVTIEEPTLEEIFIHYYE